MKSKLFLVLICALLSTEVQAQGFLKRLGRAVESAAKEHINNNRRSSQERSGDNEERETPPQRRETPSQPVTVKDHGQNIRQESGLDYIDEYGINHGGGILIAGILWAPVNCGYHATDYPYGKIFQWGRKHGQGYGAPFTKKAKNTTSDKTTANVVPAPVTPAEARKHPNNYYAKSPNASFNWTRNDIYLWNPQSDNCVISKSELNDPCPKGWRLPDLQDFYKLAAHFSESTEYPEGGPEGVWFSGDQPYSVNVPRIFLPYVGLRDVYGEAYGRDNIGAYWSGRHGGGEGLVWHLYFVKGSGDPDVGPSAFPHEGYAVRCVKDVKGQIAN